MSKTIHHVRLFINTARYLKAAQVWRRATRHFPRVGPMLPEAPELRAVRGTWSAAIARPNPQAGPNRFRFLNQEYEIRTWNDDGIPKLWIYNLHYMENPGTEIIEQWIRENAPTHGPGWEPYPLSARIVSWTKWTLAGNRLSSTALESLAIQAQFLEKSVEYHLKANHIFANATALIFAGTFFSGVRASRWLDLGLRILDQESREQILPDGGHFERSPMYHSLIVEDLLDLINLAQAFRGVIPHCAWRETASRMLRWLVAMCHPDGRISFFNDATFGVAAEPAELLAYARRLGIEPAEPLRTLGPANDERTPLGCGGNFSCSPRMAAIPSPLESGYVRLENDKAVVLFDAAPIGPDYQPGHAHADTLSFELSVCGVRVLVNSGTSTYEDSPERRRQRGTAAHNTVLVDREDQSEMWKSFRVARRAKPIHVTSDNATFAEASHTGYLRLADPVLHTRRLELHSDILVVIDSLAGLGVHEIEIPFHLHPMAAVALSLDQKLARSTEEARWFPGFNLAAANYRIVGRWSGQLPVAFETLISF